MLPEELKQNVTVYGPFFPEPVQVIIAVPMGASVKLIGKGVRSSTVYEPILSTEQVVQLHASPSKEPFDGDAGKFRLGVEAMRLGLASSRTASSFVRCPPRSSPAQRASAQHPRDVS